MYDKSDLTWLYRYYSGDRLEDIAVKLFISTSAAKNRLQSMRLPQRPRGAFTCNKRERWLNEPHVRALRRLFQPLSGATPMGTPAAMIVCAGGRASVSAPLRPASQPPSLSSGGAS